MGTDPPSPPRNKRTLGFGLESSDWCPPSAAASSVAVTSTSSLNCIEQVDVVNSRLVYNPTLRRGRERVPHGPGQESSPKVGFLRDIQNLQEHKPQEISSHQDMVGASDVVAGSLPFRRVHFDDRSSAPQGPQFTALKSELQPIESPCSSPGLMLQIRNQNSSGPTNPMTSSKRNDKWASDADTKYNPRNHPETLENKSNSDIPSNEADFGEAVRLRKIVGEQGYQLADWTGGFAPAPVDWDDRPRFVDEEIEHRVQEWKDKSDPDTRPIKIGNGNPFSGGEIVPQSWIPSTVDGLNLENWWNEHLREPGILHDIEPFWLRFATNSLEHLDALKAPEATLEPSDNDMITAKRQTSEQSMLTFDNKQLRKAQTVRKNRDAKLALSHALQKYVPTPNPHAPRVNVFIRPLEARDLDQIATICNQYVKNSICSPETAPIRPSAIRSRWEDINEARLPFLVVVDRSTKSNRRRDSEKTANKDEHILGYGLVDDYHDISGMYRYTVEVEVFIKPEFTRCGIGRCVLDKLLFILDPHHIESGGCDFFGDEVTYGSGGKRVVNSIIINAPYDSKDRTKLEWLQKWLGKFEFKMCGDLPAVGHKLNTVVNQAILLKKTGSGVGAGAL